MGRQYWIFSRHARLHETEYHSSQKHHWHQHQHQFHNIPTAHIYTAETPMIIVIVIESKNISKMNAAA